jgi:hypothetical protein
MQFMKSNISIWNNASKIEKVLLILLILFSVSAWFISFRMGYVLTYNDAASHLNIARRIVDNLTPGLAQIGTVWLPLPHILMLLFAWNDTLWHTGIAGSIVSMISYIVFVVFIYKSLLLLTNNRRSALIGAVVAALNPNLLYLQTTPMTEPLLLATFSLTTFYFVRYIQSDQILDLVLTGISVAMATLTRYDGWFLFVSLFLVLFIRALIRKGWKKAEGALILFLTIGGFGIFLWLLWNLAIFHNALYFILGPYSAYAQQSVLRKVGQLPTQGNLFTSLTIFGWSVIDNNGFILVILAVIAFVVLCMKIERKYFLPLFIILAAPFIFNILALFVGQSAMNVPQALHNPGYFNIRYGLLILPSLAILLGLISTRKLFRYVVLVGILIQTGLFVRTGTPVTLIDGLQGLKNTYYTVEASSWFRKNYTGGLILTSLASHDAFVARTGLPMKNYIHEGTREFWNNALILPSKDASYITMLSYPPDIVYKSVAHTSDFLLHYTLVHSYGTFEIYKRK